MLADAQRLGYAEADPSADVDGFDAASKTAIMASIGFHTRVTTDEVYQQGIRQVSAEDIAVAADMGYTIKLLGIARMTAAGVEARVHPTMIPNGHQLAAVSGAMNAVYVVGDAVGTHEAREADMTAACQELEKLDAVRSVANVIRIEDTSKWLEGAMEN